MIHLRLPYPPSVNCYWRHVSGKTLISAEGRAYRKAVLALILAHGVRSLPNGPLRVEITAFPPDHRRRDLDNILKALLDALEHAGVYEDDSLIADLHIRRGPVIPAGQVYVNLERV